MILTIFFAILIANGVSTEHVRVLAKAGNGEKIPIDITVQGGSVTTITGQPSPAQSFFTPSVNLYDSNKHLEVRRVADKGMCFVQKFKGTFSQMKHAVDGLASAKMTAKASENWNIPGKEIKRGELEETVGPKITAFCSGYKVVWQNTNKKVIKQQALLAKRGWEAALNGGYNRGSGWGAKGGLSYSNGRGFSAGVNGGWSQGGGWGVSAGLSWKFGK